VADPADMGEAERRAYDAQLRESFARLQEATNGKLGAELHLRAALAEVERLAWRVLYLERDLRAAQVPPAQPEAERESRRMGRLGGWLRARRSSGSEAPESPDAGEDPGAVHSLPRPTLWPDALGLLDAVTPPLRPRGGGETPLVAFVLAGLDPARAREALVTIGEKVAGTGMRALCIVDALELGPLPDPAIAFEYLLPAPLETGSVEHWRNTLAREGRRLAAKWQPASALAFSAGFEFFVQELLIPVVLPPE
jgi:hypothetical protein